MNRSGLAELYRYGASVVFPFSIRRRMSRRRRREGVD
jgi:hypothetical protein